MLDLWKPHPHMHSKDRAGLKQASPHRCSSSFFSVTIITVLLGLVQWADAGVVAKDAYGFGGRRASNGIAGSDGLRSPLDLQPDPRDPRPEGFEPRKNPGEGGDLWTFGKVHALVHHVLEHARLGDPVAVADELDAFSSKHKLDLGFGAERGPLVDQIVRTAIASLQHAATVGSTGSVMQRELRILVLGAGLGGCALRCLPALLASGPSNEMHQVVSVEGDADLASAGEQLVSHAVGSGGNVTVQHTPLMPGDDTTLAEVLETLRDGYDLGQFDVAFLTGRRDRAAQQGELAALLNSGALRDPGAIVLAFGPGTNDAGTQQYLNFLNQHGRGRFGTQVRNVGEGAAIVSTLQGHADDSEL